jgi:hypothetical protein
VTGRVLTADSTPVRGARLVLHQIGRKNQGPIDSARSDSRGRFRFAFRPDTSAFYLVSGRYAGIEYFSAPLATNPARADTGIRIVVFDTSSAAPVALEARHFVLTRPDSDGARSVLDLILLRNTGRLTRVARDTASPSWIVPLPHGTSGLQVGEGDFSADAVSRSGDSLILTAPLAPGEKQLAIQYQVQPGRRIVELPLDYPGLTVNVLAEERDVRVVGRGVALADSQVIQGRSFRRWTGHPPAGVVRLLLPGPRGAPPWLLPALVVGLGLGLAGVGWLLFTRRAQPMPEVLPGDLVDAIAALDARYLGRESETPPEEWSLYQVERARLKADLHTSLAAGRWSQ